jgi:hypothetical protein
MWPLVLVALCSAVWFVISSLNQGIMNRFVESRAEIIAGRMLAEQSVQSGGYRPSGYTPDTTLFGYAQNTVIACTYTKAPYEPKQGYLPFLIERTNNTYLCVGRKGGGNFVRESRAVTFNACIDDPVSRPASALIAAAPEGAVVMCQRK